MSNTFRKLMDFPVGLQTSKTASVGFDIPNLSQVQAIVAGLNLAKEAVAVDSDTNVDIATGGLIAIDGYQTLDGDRVLLHSQTDASENGIYVASSGAWARAADADESVELKTGASVTVLNGTHAGRKYELQEDEPVIGTSSQTWVVTSASSSAALDVTTDQTNFSILNGANAQAVFESIDSEIAIIKDSADLMNGAGVGAANLGTFAGFTITDNQSIKGALQELEVAHEGLEAQLINERYESSTTTLTTGNAINFTHSMGVRWLSSVAVYDSSTGEDITHTVIITAADANNITVQNDSSDIDVVVTCRK